MTFGTAQNDDKSQKDDTNSVSAQSHLYGGDDNPSYWTIISMNFSLSLAITITYGASMIILMVNQALVGQLGEVEKITAVGICSSTIMSLVVNIIQGMNRA